MRTFSEMSSGERGRVRHPLELVRVRLKSARRGAEDGFLLIEVMMSALLVSLIVVATFNGLDTATKISADQRRHDEAAILAAQSQEQLRSEPASALVALETSPHKYTRTVGGTNFTITQGAKAAGKSGEEETTECSVTSTKSETQNIQISSSVTWAALERIGRPPVKQASVITPPTGSAIEIDVINGTNAGVSGITARATYIPAEGGATSTIEGTTGTNGCVVLAGIPATSAEVEIVERIGFVTKAGALKVPIKKLTIAPNITTHYIVPYAEAGRIAARYTYKGATSYEGKEVVGDTFVAQQAEEFEAEPKYEVGATYFKYEGTGEERFTPILGTCNTALICVPRNKIVPAYESTAYTAAGSKYPNGDLFPYKEGWRVWAGDCEANATGEGVVKSKAITSGGTTTVEVPLGYTQLSVYKGYATGHEGSFEEEHLGPARITNEACEAATKPPNSVTQTFVHEQTETLAKGRLEDPFQPFGTFSLCLYDKKLNKSYTVGFTNAKAATPATPTIYLEQLTASEQSAEKTTLNAAVEKLNSEEAAAETAKTTRKTEETEAAAAKAKRVKEEEEATTARTKRAKEETEATAPREKRQSEEKTAETAKKGRETSEKEAETAKSTRETKEASERTTWKNEETAKKITLAQRQAKEATQTTNRKNTEATEKTAREKRSKEETEATAPREKRQSEEKTAETAKKTRETEETNATAAKNTRSTEETNAASAKKNRETEETAAISAKETRVKNKTTAEANKTKFEERTAAEGKSGVTVEAGSTC